MKRITVSAAFMASRASVTLVALVFCSSCSSSLPSSSPSANPLPSHKVELQPTASALVGQAAVTELKAAALAIPDLPFGWAVSPPSADSSVTAPCAALTPSGSAQLPAQTETDFQASEDGPFLQEILASGPAQQVRDVWASIRQAASRCSATASGTDTTRLSATSFPAYGDESYALRLTASRSGVSYDGDVVVVRKGQVYIEVAAFGMGGVAASTVQQLVGKAVDKV